MVSDSLEILVVLLSKSFPRYSLGTTMSFLVLVSDYLEFLAILLSRFFTRYSLGTAHVISSIGLGFSSHSIIQISLSVLCFYQSWARYY